jgi:hypothetical protein
MHFTWWIGHKSLGAKSRMLHGAHVLKLSPQPNMGPSGRKLGHWGCVHEEGTVTLPTSSSTTNSDRDVLCCHRPKATMG